MEHTIHVVEHSVGRVGVLDKTVEVLEALSSGPASLADLSRETGIPKPTLHRLCGALESHGLVSKDPDDRRRLGPRISQWANGMGSDYERLLSAAEPVMRELRDETGESVQLYVVENSDLRRCIAAIESPHGLRTIVDVGSLLPVNAGSAGAVLRGSNNARTGWVQSVEEREKGVASVSAPVMDGEEVIAAISVSGPIERTTRNPGRRYGSAVLRAANALSLSS